MTTSPKPGGGTYVYLNDAVGNRTWRNENYNTGAVRYIWDALNRMTSCCQTSMGARYEYRADGMRTKKVEGLTVTWTGEESEGSGFYDEVWAVNKPTTRYWYDGQMTIAEDRTETSQPYKLDTYGIGRRGIDFLAHNEKTSGTWGTETQGFPLYDGHGNMVATLARSGSTSCSVGNVRSYDAWGNIRSGSTTGSPNNRYCGNLGHKHDDESGLIHMRARYYEPGTGRFVSEDLGRQGTNWLAYCGNNPVRNTDRNGRWFDEEVYEWFNHVGRDPMFGQQIQEIVSKFQSGQVNSAGAASMMAAIWYNLAANFYPGAAGGLGGAWKLCVKIPQTLVDILTESFDWGEGISGEIEEIVEQAAEMTFTWLEEYRG